MSSRVLFRFLETCSSEVARKTLFKTRHTKYMPDFIFIFLYISIFVPSAILERILIFNIFLIKNYIISGSFFLYTSLGPLIYVLLFEKEECFPEIGSVQVCRIFVKTIFLFIGLDPILIGGKVLTETFEMEEDSTTDPPEYFRFFHISNRNLSFIKIYCCILTAVKSIPQLFFISIFLLWNNDGFFALIAKANIFFNMLIFSLTIAITLPLRKSPRIFKTSTSVILNGFCKFMATMCACGLTLTIFTLAFSQIGFAAFLINCIRIVWSIWPTWRALNSKSQPLSCLCLWGLFFSFIFNFIYIHPFEGKGKLFYYYFYLLSLLTDIASIYILTDANYDYVIIFYAMRVLIIGFVSCFGLVNIWQNVKSESKEKEKKKKKKIKKKKKEKASERSMLNQPQEAPLEQEAPSKSR